MRALRMADPRDYQIGALAILLALNMAWLDFGAQPAAALCAVAGAIGAQLLCTRLWRLPRLELRSALITSFSLSLLLRTNDPLLYAAAGAIAITAKFTLRIDGKHLWNPATFAIVALRFGTDLVWISPGQWGAALLFAALLGFLAILVLQRARRADTALFFLAAHTLLLLLRAAMLGDPPSIPLHQLESGSLLLFAFFMITDPRTTPDHRLGRLVFAVAVAALAHYIAFYQQMREALYLALFLLAPAVPLLDRLIPAPRFDWRNAAAAPRPL